MGRRPTDSDKIYVADYLTNIVLSFSRRKNYIDTQRNVNLMINHHKRMHPKKEIC